MNKEWSKLLTVKNAAIAVSVGVVVIGAGYAINKYYFACDKAGDKGEKKVADASIHALPRCCWPQG